MLEGTEIVPCPQFTSPRGESFFQTHLPHPMGLVSIREMWRLCVRNPPASAVCCALCASCSQQQLPQQTLLQRITLPMLKRQNIIRDVGKAALRIQHIFINITLTLMLSWEDVYSWLLPGTSLCTWLLLLGLLTCVCSGLRVLVVISEGGKAYNRYSVLINIILVFYRDCGLAGRPGEKQEPRQLTVESRAG